MTDVFLYNGEIERGSDFKFIEFVSEHKKQDDLLLIFTTTGGNPDAAYKMGRYVQDVYDGFKFFVPGICKSAGTLLAIAANEIIFSPYGELGPLDVQLAKSDHLFEQDSGLNISEAFKAIEDRAKTTFHELVGEIVSGSGGRIAFTTASHCASEIIASLYGPVFGTIDAEEVGSRMRAMRIGEDYGLRLNQKFKNLRDGALAHLSQTYSSHSFVIDMQETKALFERVREASEQEKQLVEGIGSLARMPNPKVSIHDLTEAYDKINEQESEDDEAINNEGKKEGGAKRARQPRKSNGTDSTRPVTG